ncbi:MAG: Crp/Fnr family transcriptional regulator [Cyclobacteriaceae bacterium]
MFDLDKKDWKTKMENITQKNKQPITSCTVGKNQMCCFETLCEEEMALIEENSVDIIYQKGETICKQGAFASHVMVVEEGLAKIFLESNEEILILKILPAVNIIGLTSLIEGNNTFQYSATAYMKTSVKLIEINTFKELIKNNGQFAAKIISLIAESTVVTYGRFFCLTKKHTYGRMADVLLCLSRRVYKKGHFPLQLSRKELAELSSMCVESIARILTKFKEDKVIEINQDSIEILDFERLDMISRNG